jgi:hypothetical protein
MIIVIDETTKVAVIGDHARIGKIQFTSTPESESEKRLCHLCKIKDGHAEACPLNPQNVKNKSDLMDLWDAGHEDSVANRGPRDDSPTYMLGYTSILR